MDVRPPEGNLLMQWKTEIPVAVAHLAENARSQKIGTGILGNHTNEKAALRMGCFCVERIFCYIYWYYRLVTGFAMTPKQEWNIETNQ